MRALVLAAALGIALSGCSSGAAGSTAPNPGTSDSPPTTGVRLLAAVTLTGGLCPEGVCTSNFEVHTDGTWTSTTASTSTQGRLPPHILAEVERATARTGIASAPSFTGTCPIAYDGSEAIYSWLTPAGADITVSACEKAIAESDPLVVALDAARDAVSDGEDPLVRAGRIAAAVIGMAEVEAVALVEGVSSMPMSVRVVSRDGEALPVTEDYSPTRVNLAIVDGTVTEATVG